MAEVNANSLPAKTDLGTNDSAIVVDRTTNAGALVDLDVLADKVLDRISSKTFANQVGGSSAATLLAQLSTLNSNIAQKKMVDVTISATSSETWFNTNIEIHTTKRAFIYVYTGYTDTYATAIGLNSNTATASYEMKKSHVNASNGADCALFYNEATANYKLWLKSKSISEHAFNIKVYVIGDPDATATIPS